MKFIDEINIRVQAGNGGNGIISFRREANVDRGGPDGGDGGKGGDIYFQGDDGLNTLLPFYYQNKYIAQSGENGKSKNQYGANGEDLIIKVPLGTMVFNGEKLLADITTKDKYLIALGGKGGRGNLKFKSSRNTAPRLCENGELGEVFDLKLNLKVLADIGFVGKPSAGKSSILSIISNAKPKIASYDFTTLTPQLGLVKYYNTSFVVADLPGLIEFASQGKGLGIQFLKHIERCKAIAHVIDFGDENKNPIEDYLVINNELKSYNLFLEKIKQVIIANKSDLPKFKEHLKLFKKKFPKLQIVTCSALLQDNIEEVKKTLFEIYKKSKDTLVNTQSLEKEEITISLDKDDLEIIKINNNTYEIKSTKVSNLYHKIPLVSIDNLWRFNYKLKGLGVYDALKAKGIKHGDIVKIEDFEFSWEEE